MMMYTDAELLSFALRASLEAGRAILSIYHGDIAVTLKGDDSPLTQADMDAHGILSSRLSSTGIPVLSEEAADVPYEIRKKWKHYWLIDPLDGTKEFIHRNGEFTVNIALMDNGKPLLGVVYAPATDELYAGHVGRGAWYASGASALRSVSLEDMVRMEPFTSKHRQPEDRYIVAVSRSHLDARTMEYLADLKKSKGEVQTISAGSSMKLCLVAAGKADEYPRFGPTSEWDIAAGHAILLAVHKDVISMDDQQSLKYNKPELRNAGFIAR